MRGHREELSDTVDKSLWVGQLDILSYIRFGYNSAYYLKVVYFCMKSNNDCFCNVQSCTSMYKFVH